MPLVQHSQENLEVEKTITNLTLENFSRAINRDYFLHLYGIIHTFTDNHS